MINADHRQHHKSIATSWWHKSHTWLAVAVILLLTGIARPSSASQDNLNVPCRFRDSINITDGLRDSDENIIFEDLTYTKNDYGIYDYEFVNDIDRRPVAPHLRGCVCRLKTCVRFCCARGEHFENGCTHNAIYNDLQIALMDRDNDTVNLFEEFGYVVGKPCNEVIAMTPDEYPDDAWAMLSNGSVFRYGGAVLDKEHYCLNPRLVVNTSMPELQLLVCFEEGGNVKYSILPVGMLLSVPFLVVTFLVYAILPELRNVHGKSLMCYLIGLAVGYSVLSWVQLNTFNPVEPILCRSIGYIIYFSFMSAFFWLSVISFDLWWNFRHFVAIVRGIKGISKLADHKKFLVYSTYAWGSSLFMAGMCYLLDSSTLLSSQMQPGIGFEGCFLKKYWLTEFLYFYLPIIVIIGFNFTFFMLTALKIRRVQVEMARVTAKEDSRRHQTHLDNEKDKFGLFLRLFIVMGVTWCMEAISWAIDPGSWVFYVSDLCNTVQGVLIFVLFVMKPKVKQLILKRWRIWRGIKPVQRGTSSSGTTRSSNITMVTQTPITERSLMTDIRD